MIIACSIEEQLINICIFILYLWFIYYEFNYYYLCYLVYFGFFMYNSILLITFLFLKIAMLLSIMIKFRSNTAMIWCWLFASALWYPVFLKCHWKPMAKQMATYPTYLCSSIIVKYLAITTYVALLRCIPLSRDNGRCSLENLIKLKSAFPSPNTLPCLDSEKINASV